MRIPRPRFTLPLRRAHPRLRGSTLAALAGLPLLGLALGTADGPPVRTFSFALETEVPGSPEEAYDAFTGDVSGWWDHTFSGDPLRLEIEPKPGGAFLEVFDESGDGVQHAVVTWADRGERLVLRGPLGLHGEALDLVATLDFAATDAGTRVSLRVNSMGALEEDVASIVESVWRHFLLEQYRPWAARRAEAGAR